MNHKKTSTVKKKKKVKMVILLNRFDWECIKIFLTAVLRMNEMGYKGFSAEIKKNIYVCIIFPPPHSFGNRQK